MLSANLPTTYILRKSKQLYSIKTEPMNLGKIPVHRLCVFASGSWIISIRLLCTEINVSFPHFGQYSGNFCITVSCLILIRVFPEHTGHRIQSCLILLSSPLYLIIIHTPYYAKEPKRCSAFGPSRFRRKSL